jgi:hypothetical protein
MLFTFVGLKFEMTSLTGEVLGTPPPNVRVIFKDGAEFAVTGSGVSTSIGVEGIFKAMC